jgi:two-component system, NarL family, nitrate/nitrite response regulator NarL
MIDTWAETDTVRVVIADDHPLYRAALGEVISGGEGMELVAAASDGREAFAYIRRELPTVALLDVRMPVWDGPAVARRIERDGLPTRVLFLSEYGQGETVFRALSAGGSGYLSKAATGEEIRTAILRVAAGEEVLAAEAGQGLVRRIRAQGGEGPALSEREREILQGIASGQSAREMAEALHLAVPTVKTHLQHVYGKLGVSDRGAAVAEAMRRGLVD